VQRPLQTTVAIALGMARDPNGKISELEEMLATACAVQNMHLTSTAYGLGAFWSTGAAITGDGMRDFLGLGAKDRCLGIFYMGYPAVDWPKGYRRSWVDVTTWRNEG
jgi:nitroreductase